MAIIITPKAQRQYNLLSRTEQAKIKKKLVILENEPFAGKKLSGDLNGLRSLRAWPYRIIYFINKNQEIIYVVSIAHRQGVYK